MAEKAKVWWCDFRSKNGENLPHKMMRLAEAAGIGKMNFDGVFTAIKLHFGEPGNLAYLRPQYAKALADYVKEKGGRPFLTDCNTLYPGFRKNALDHLDAAYMNGFDPMQVGCHVIIGDGLKGTDDTAVPFPEGEYIKEARIGRAVMDAEAIISLTHFKLHEMSGYGGAIKNIGMGCGSRAGKMAQHNSGKPVVEPQLCVGCGTCVRNCAQDAIVLEAADGGKRKARIIEEKCAGCGRCIGECPRDAIHATVDNSCELLCRKMAEYAAAVVKGRPQFHISLIVDVSPFCDCYGANDAPVIANIGMFASADAVALDQACADAVNAAKPLEGTLLSEAKHTHGDWSMDVHPVTNWNAQLEQAVKGGMGTREYELIKVE